MPRLFITGTDTGVGKTRVTAMLARALRLAGDPPTIVKLVQTGLSEGEEGDAAQAGRLAGCEYLELARLRHAADPYSAALAEGAPVLRAADLLERLNGLSGPLLVEGSGGIAVPLNEREEIARVALEAGLPVLLVVGLRLGCINHALLTLAYCESMGLSVAGAVLIEHLGPGDPVHRRDVERILRRTTQIFGALPFATDELSSVEEGAQILGESTLWRSC